MEVQRIYQRGRLFWLIFENAFEFLCRDNLFLFLLFFKKRQQNDVVQANLVGISRKMKDKNWVDSQGRKGKGYGVYKFADKYGVSRKLKV